MIVVLLILAIMAGLASLLVGSIAAGLFWAASLILPPEAIFGLVVGIAVFPCFYVYFAKRA